MFITLLIVTFVISLGVSYAVVRMFSMPVENILERIIADDISVEWLKYLKFAILVVGVSNGVRIWDLEKYITPLQYEDAKIVALNANRWVLEVYRTIISTLQGIAWLLLVFFVFALIAYVIVRIFEARQQRSSATETT